MSAVPNRLERHPYEGTSVHSVTPGVIGIDQPRPLSSELP